MKEHGSRSLTRREFDAVIRRAAELASSEGDGGPGGELTEQELFRIAGEVGLSEGHVRRALAEVRTGGRGPLDRVFGPALVQAVRVVPLPAEEAANRLDEFLAATRLLQRVRRTDSILHYRPALDWASQIARAASFTSRKYYVAGANSVEVRLSPAGEGHTVVEITVDPGTRGDSVAGAVFGGGAVGIGLGIAVGASLAAVAPLAVAAGAGVLAGGGTTAGVTFAVGRSHKRKLLEVRTEVEGILDALERGDSLEPPPPSWLRWVKRRFHGVARELMDPEEG